MTQDNIINPVNIISASAGTGKTYTLSGEYVKALKSLTGNAGIITTTFTNKAADELSERVRRFLLKEGEWQAAQSVLSGYLGTVNAICGRILSEHAIEAGVSPDFTVISEERLPAVFAIAVDTVIHQFADELHDAAFRLQMENWRSDVRLIIDQARHNSVGTEKLQGFAESSWSRLQALLPALNPAETAEVLDANLAHAVETALEQLRVGNDLTDATLKATEDLLEVNRRLKSHKLLVWQVWARLAALQVGSESRKIVQPVIHAAQTHSRHPRLHADLKTAIFGVFGCAAAALQQYATFKGDHGLIDFVDQEHRALRILARLPDVRERFKQRTQILLVDEFQDTSPIQLAVFLEMARLVDYSVWVGDEKQSIFSFRGSDPELMRQAMEQLVPISGGTMNRLVKSYRSRPSLVRFTNALFSQCAETMRITPGSAAIEEVHREEQAQLNHPLHLWWLKGSHQQLAEMALAKGVADIIARPDDWNVVDKNNDQDVRPIRGADIAILCRTNDRRMSIARALTAQGLTVATERDSLLDAAECVLSVAALRILIDESDTLAVAEIANLVGDDGNGRWLDTWLNQDRAHVEAGLPCIERIKAARAVLFDRTPSEALELAISHGGVIDTIMKWGNVRQRLANLDALRGLAKTYEDLCISAKTPATAAGLVIYIHKNVPDGGNQPANPDDNGIHVLTYHKSKGLEWPLVILHDLDNPGRGTPFGIKVESAQAKIDPLKPLEERAIRYWPWPYGKQRKGTYLLEKAGKTKEAGIANAQAAAESLRLLYVGMTRARDYLVLSCRPGSYSTGWLDMLVDENNLKMMTLNVPEQSDQAELIDGVPESLAMVEVKHAPEMPAFEETLFETTFAAPGPVGPAETHRGYYLNPSGATEGDFTVVHAGAHAMLTIAERIAFTGNPDMPLLGDCVHAFFAVDDPALEATLRQETATKVLKRWGVDNLTASQLIEAADRLRHFVHDTHPSCNWHTEVPVSGLLAGRRIQGTIDLLLESDDHYVIIDHKSFPGKLDEWEKRALSHSHQLALYKYMIEQTTGKPVRKTYIHMPIVGIMVAIDCNLEAAVQELKQSLV